ncbi:tRNA-dihydrouridine synthase [Pseudomonas sp. NPDC088368]|uniref:oxidoreductase n=1 Tax=Pseudomonas sp. NPDC088368 TaxID=3364453 RepID=UPI00382A9D9B
MSTSERKILTAFDIGHLTLKNRFAVAPMTRVSATREGNASETMAQYYERFAKGGFGLVITEGIYTDRTFAQGYPFQPGITDDEQALAWRSITQRVQGHQARIFAQLMHAGALSQGNRFVETSTAPSAIRPKGEQMGFYYGEGQYRVPVALTDEDIAGVIEGFAQSARRAIDTAGFDGVEIHGANGYLLDQFLTDYTNQRNDRWGGSLQKRIALTLAVVNAVKAVAGDAPVGVRISQTKVNDYTHQWAEGEQAAEVFFGALQDAGVDYLHVTAHTVLSPAFTGVDSNLIQLARRYAPHVPLIANGGLDAVQDAERALEDGAQLIALGKPALANPDYPKRIAQNGSLNAFDPSILGPIANIKDQELAFQ